MDDSLRTPHTDTLVQTWKASAVRVERLQQGGIHTVPEGDGHVSLVDAVIAEAPEKEITCYCGGDGQVQRHAHRSAGGALAESSYTTMVRARWSLCHTGAVLHRFPRPEFSTAS